MGNEEIKARIKKLAKEATEKVKDIDLKEAQEKIVDKAKDFAEKGEVGIKKIGDTVADAAQKMLDDMKLKELQPLFASDFNNPDFLQPDLVRIVEKDKKHSDPLCDGCVGWVEYSKKSRIYNLINKELNSTGYNFYPVANLGELYIANTVIENQFLPLADYFGLVQKEIFAELENVAFSLGAKYYSIELLVEKEVLINNTLDSKTKARGVAAVEAKQDEKEKTYISHGIQAQKQFISSAEPTRPTLKWLSNDPQVKSLIDQVLSGRKSKDMSIGISSQYVNTISVDRAAKIDEALSGLKAQGNTSIRSKAEEQKRSELKFHLEF